MGLSGVNVCYIYFGLLNYNVKFDKLKLIHETLIMFRNYFDLSLLSVVYDVPIVQFESRIHV